MFKNISVENSFMTFLIQAFFKSDILPKMTPISTRFLQKQPPTLHRWKQFLVLESLKMRRSRLIFSLTIFFLLFQFLLILAIHIFSSSMDVTKKTLLCSAFCWQDNKKARKKTSQISNKLFNFFFLFICI